MLQPEQTIQMRTSIIDKENKKIEDAIVVWTSENNAVAIEIGRASCRERV